MTFNKAVRLLAERGWKIGINGDHWVVFEGEWNIIAGGKTWQEAYTNAMNEAPY